MSLYTDYLEEIETRKEQGLHPKPIEDAELVEELVGQIKDLGHEHRAGSLHFFIYNTLPGTTSAAGVKARSQVPGGVRKHCRATAGILDDIRERTGVVVFAGLHLEELATQARLVADSTPDHGLHPQLVDGHFDWWLVPAETI